MGVAAMTFLHPLGSQVRLLIIILSNALDRLPSSTEGIKGFFFTNKHEVTLKLEFMKPNILDIFTSKSHWWELLELTHIEENFMLLLNLLFCLAIV